MRLIVLFSVICLSVSKELDSYKDFKVFAAKNHYKTVSDYANSIGVTQLDRRWKKFKLKYKRNYRPKEEEKRKFNFLKTLLFVKKHNNRYKKGKETHGVGIDRFSDWSLEQFKKMYPPEILDKWDQNNKPGKRTRPVYYSSLPESFDWRDKGVVSWARYQGTCNSCWAFGATAVIESLYAIKKNITVQLSMQQLVDCDPVSKGCTSGNMRAGLSYAQSDGLVKYDDYPYKYKKQDCMNTTGMVKYYIGGVKKFPQPSSDNEIKAAILEYGPVLGSLDTQGSDFLRYKKGIISTGGQKSDHTVTIVGWGPDYWIVNNNGWNFWGEWGVGKIAQGNNVRGINDYIIGAYF